MSGEWRVTLSCGCVAIVDYDPGEVGDDWICAFHGDEELAALIESPE